MWRQLLTRANNPTEKRHRKNSPSASTCCTRDEASRLHPAPASVPAPAPVAAATGQVVPLTTLQNAVVRNMVASLGYPTHVGYTITTDELDKLYKQIKSKALR